MRLWSVHPKYLDAQGLLALWREGLLAQKVLMGETKGYVNHPQLSRFRRHPDPLKAISGYLLDIYREAEKRRYRFDLAKIGETGEIEKIPLTDGQLNYEYELLCAKMKSRSPEAFRENCGSKKIACHPSFKVIKGGIEEWEKIKVL